MVIFNCQIVVIASFGLLYCIFRLKAQQFFGQYPGRNILAHMARGHVQPSLATASLATASMARCSIKQTVIDLLYDCLFCPAVSDG